MLGVIANIKGAVYTLALTAATISAASGVADMTLVPLWGFLSLGSFIASLLLRNLRSHG